MGCNTNINNINNRYSAHIRTNNPITSITFRLYQSKQEVDISNDNNNDDNNEKIRELILSISLESDDEKRRKRLSDTLEQNINQEKDVIAAAQFAHLWDVNIIKIGQEIQNEARMEAENKAAALAGEEEKDDDGSRNMSNSSDDTNNEKSMKEKQLWSMVDMMVQSKTLIKKLSTVEEK